MISKGAGEAGKDAVRPAAGQPPDIILCSPGFGAI